MKSFAIVCCIALFAAAWTVSGICELQIENSQLKDRIDRLESMCIDSEQRLHLYRAALSQTEVTDLKAAEVFETTEAYRHLISEMDEHEQFANDTTIEEE